MANRLCDVLLTRAELTAPALPGDGASGAVADFHGVVRQMESGRELRGIEYEAHAAMAEHQMRRIAQSAIERFSVAAIWLHHRIGFVAVGEPSLFLRVTSSHRGAALAAQAWIVDELKKHVPIWKRPVYAEATATAPQEAIAK